MKTAGWITLNEAHETVVKVVQAPALAERLLIDWLRSGAMRWRCRYVEGHKQPTDPDFVPSDSTFWAQYQETPRPQGGQRQRIELLRVNWAESSAHQTWLGLSSRYAVYRVEVPRADLLKVLCSLPAPTASPKIPISAIERAMRALIDIFGERRPPPELKLAEIARRVAHQCKQRGWASPGLDTVARALIDLGWRESRKKR